MRPEVGHRLELVHEHGSWALGGQACRDIDVVVGVRNGCCLDLDHLCSKGPQEVNLFCGLEAGRSVYKAGV